MMKKPSFHEVNLKMLLFRSAFHGMTLIELLVVIVMLGILTAVTIPSLLNSIRRSRVAEAQTALAEVGRASEIYRVDFMVYPMAYADIEFGGTHGDRYLQDPWQAPNYRLPEVVPPLHNEAGIRWMTEAYTYVVSSGDPVRCDIGLGDRHQEVSLSDYDLRKSCNLYQ